MPLGRREECPACHADLHACRQCTFFDPAAPQGCREPVADPVKDKDRANFCGYFTLNATAHVAADDREAQAARAKLNDLFGAEDTAKDGPADAAALFGLPADAEPQDEAARAKRELESLFGLDDASKSD